MQYLTSINALMYFKISFFVKLILFLSLHQIIHHKLAMTVINLKQRQFFWLKNLQNANAIYWLLILITTGSSEWRSPWRAALPGGQPSMAEPKCRADWAHLAAYGLVLVLLNAQLLSLQILVKVSTIHSHYNASYLFLALVDQVKELFSFSLFAKTISDSVWLMLHKLKRSLSQKINDFSAVYVKCCKSLPFRVLLF